MTTNKNTKNKQEVTDKNPFGAGCPTLSEQAVNAHKKAEIRIDVTLGKVALKAVKHLVNMMDKIDTLKENTQLVVVDKILRHNKEFMKAYNEQLSSANNKTKSVEEIEEYEDDMVMISITPQDSNKSLN